MIINKRAGCIGIYGQKLLFVENSKQEIILVKGHLEKGESYTEAAIREFTEETGYFDFNLDPELIDKLVYFRGENEKFIIYIYLVKLSSLKLKEKTSADGKKLKSTWLKIDEAEEIVTHKNLMPIIRKIQKII